MSDTSDKTSVISTETFKGKLKAADEAPPAIVVLVGPQGYVGKQWLLTRTDMTIGRSVETEVQVQRLAPPRPPPCPHTDRHAGCLRHPHVEA